MRATSAPGTVFVGDVRSLSLLPAFHASLELPLGIDAFRQRTASGFLHEQELALDPRFFHALKRLRPTIGRVETLLRRVRYRNEMTCFRYDALLHRRGGSAVATAPAAESGLGGGRIDSA